MSKTIKVNNEKNVLLDVVENIIVDNNNSSKKNIKDKCCAAVNHKTKQNSLDDLNRGCCVYLTEKNTTGKNTIYSSYVQCNKNKQDDNLFCHIHANTKPSNLIIMNDLIKYAIQAKKNHEYYSKKDQEYYDDKEIRGTKGKKKLIRDMKELVSTKNITYILESDNNSLMKNLEQYAEQLVIKLIKSKQSKTPVITEHSNDELLEFLHNKNNELKNDSVKNDSFEVESEDESSSVDNNLLESSHQNIVEMNNVEEEDEIECVEISTINGTIFFLDTSSFDVYKIIEDENILVGKLKEISEKYSQINYNGKKYSIFCQETSGGKTYLKCYITNKKFDSNLKLLK